MGPITRVGIVGGGQLAVMMAEAGTHLGLEVQSLASKADDPIFGCVDHSFVGDPKKRNDLLQLAGHCDVLTFDHELIDTRVIAQLESEGVICRPSSSALSIAIDKYRQWELFNKLQLTQPDTIVVNNVADALEAIAWFGGSAVLKVATGGYDGRGVLLDATESAVREWFPLGGNSDSELEPPSVLVQRRVAIDDELAVQVVRGAEGELATYAPVRTVQLDGMCASVQVPSALDSTLEESAMNAARLIADAIGVVGVLAVEFFVSKGQLVVNELAARPHNSGHLTIEAARTSQFENHMRAVAGMPLGSTELLVSAAAMVNVIGTTANELTRSTLPDGVTVHMYGKTPRPGRKLGHVTAVAETTQQAVALAVGAAEQMNQKWSEVK